MAVNQQRKAEKLMQARAKAKARRKQREHQPTQWSPEHRPSTGPNFANYENGNFEICRNAAERFGVRKMSEVLFELIEPLETPAMNSDQLLFLAKIGMMAWNLTLMPTESREEMVFKALNGLPRECQAVFVLLVERKLNLFPDDDRFIMDVMMKVGANGEPTMMAMSAIKPERLG